MRKIILVVGILMSGLLFTGCGVAQQASTQQFQQQVVEKTGTITLKSGNVWLLSTADGIVNITSTKVNLDNYLKKKVTVSGMFSGDTLYVDEIR